MQTTIDFPEKQLQIASGFDSEDRALHLESLYREFGGGSSRLNVIRLTLTFWRARLAWVLRSRSFEVLKRVIDLAAASLALVLLSPLFLVIAIAIKATDGGTVLFCQDRVGRWGRVFRFPKFRSMRPDAERLRAELLRQNHHGQCVTFKIPRDPRVTPVGRILRRYSLDELPQLWCVLMGDMSLVGPRPALPSEVQNYSIEERRRLDVVPGLTCIWQVSGRADVPFPQQVEMDVAYIESRSVGRDLHLILQTIPTVVAGKGAY
jgi:lipopolysaccharide/colanic/teichoic acid biosynthesis glycosyltransferase